MNTTLRISLLSVAAVFLLPGNAQALPDETTVAAIAAPTGRCDRPESLGNPQRRIVEKASQGVMPLVHFIHRTRMIYGLDVTETVAWLEQRRGALAACGIAAADPTPAAS